MHHLLSQSLVVLTASFCALGCASGPAEPQVPSRTAGSVLADRVTFSPLTDPLSKFAFPEGAPPSLVIGDAGAGCRAAALPADAVTGGLAWEFQAPAGSGAFAGLQFSDIAVDASPDADAAAYAQATLVAADDASDSLVVAKATRAGRTQVSPDDLEDWIGGKSSFILELTLAGRSVQLLRQCPDGPVAISMAAITTAQL